MDCIICQEDIFTGSASCVPCGHVFHTSCVKRWLLTNYSCPVCRKVCCSTSLLKLFLNADRDSSSHSSARRRQSDVPRPETNRSDNIPELIRNIASTLRNPNTNERNFQRLRSGNNVQNSAFHGFLASMQMPRSHRHVGVNVAEFIQVAASSR